MGRFIGEDLNEIEVAVLQAVANNAGGSRFGFDENLVETVHSHRDCRPVEGYTLEQMQPILDKLAADYLIERKEIKGKAASGLTEDGQRCNLISVW